MGTSFAVATAKPANAVKSLTNSIANCVLLEVSLVLWHGFLRQGATTKVAPTESICGLQGACCGSTCELQEGSLRIPAILTRVGLAGNM